MNFHYEEHHGFGPPPGMGVGVVVVDHGGPGFGYGGHEEHHEEQVTTTTTTTQKHDPDAGKAFGANGIAYPPGMGPGGPQA